MHADRFGAWLDWTPTDFCYISEINKNNNYCDASNTEWPCFPGKSYHGRGPIQLS